MRRNEFLELNDVNYVIRARVIRSFVARNRIFFSRYAISRSPWSHDASFPLRRDGRGALSRAPASFFLLPLLMHSFQNGLKIVKKDITNTARRIQTRDTERRARELGGFRILDEIFDIFSHDDVTELIFDRRPARFST